MLITAIAFLIGLATDWVWTKCFKSVAEHRAFHAANWSAALYICGVFSTWLLIDKAYYAMLAYVIGGWLGTFLAVKHGSKKHDVAEQGNNLSLQQETH